MNETNAGLNNELGRVRNVMARVSSALWEDGVGSGSTLLRTALQEHGLIYAIMALHFGFGWLADVSGRAPILRESPWHGHYVLVVIGMAISWLPVLAAVELWRASGRVDIAIRSFGRQYLTGRALLGVLIVAFFIAHESLLHAYWKRMLGIATPYTWDLRLYELDRALHFGNDPWRLLQPVLGVPVITAAIDTAYWVWFVVSHAFGAWIVWLPDRALRTRVLVAWALVWVLLGTVTAHLFASGGPVYFARLVPGEDPFAPLVSYLQVVHAEYGLTAVNLQRNIWNNVSTGNDFSWLSMSAMPSLHVALVVLFALALWRVNRLLGITMWAYAMIILVGSVHLGWHYAVDGYFSIGAVLAIWWFAGTITRTPAGRG